MGQPDQLRITRDAAAAAKEFDCCQAFVCQLPDTELRTECALETTAAPTATKDVPKEGTTGGTIRRTA